MKYTTKLFILFGLIMCAFMGFSVSSSARDVDTVPTDLTDQICFDFSAPLPSINSDTTTNTFVLAIGNGAYMESQFMVINVVPWSPDAGIVINVTGGNPCGVSVYCNKQFNLSYSTYNYFGSRSGGNQYNSLSSGTTQTISFPSLSPAPSKCWYGNIPVNPLQSPLKSAPCFFIEDIIDAQGVKTGQNLLSMVDQFESEFYNELLPKISYLYSSVISIQYSLSGIADDVDDIVVSVDSIDGTLSNIWSRMPKVSTYSYYDDSGHLQTYSGQYINLFLSSLGRDLHNVILSLNTIHSDLTSLSTAFQNSIQSQTNTIMGQPVQVTQPSFSDSGSVETITDDYISDLDPSSALLQDVSTPLQGMNFWRDRINELILTNNQMSVFILYILSIGLVVFFIGRRIRSE